MTELAIFTDGGARGNPGPAACAFVAIHEKKQIHQASKYLSEATNNFAEYQGVLLALSWLAHSPTFNSSQSSIHIFMDSELVVKQIQGAYKVKEPSLKLLHSEVRVMLAKLSCGVVFQYVPREKNKLADALVNEELDKNL